MVNVKAGVTGAVATLILILLESIFLPIVFSRINTAKDSVDTEAADNDTLDDAKSLYTVIMLVTVVGGLLGSLFLALKSN